MESTSISNPAAGDGNVPEKTHILLAEDHDATRESLQRLLESRGYIVTAVNDGAKATWKLITRDRPSIALIDWNLPSASGIDVCRAARRTKNASYVYLIMLTARVEEADVAEALEAGADDFLRKPYGPVELIARIRNGERTVRLERGLAARISELQEAAERINVLRRLLPICMYCKKVRDDRDYWKAIDAYFQEHTGTLFSHGVCPHCAQKMREEGIMPGFSKANTA
jgi:sigma-B regulation protein RsbU (phosphoserine phosphatase)